MGEVVFAELPLLAATDPWLVVADSELDEPDDEEEEGGVEALPDEVSFDDDEVLGSSLAVQEGVDCFVEVGIGSGFQVGVGDHVEVEVGLSLF